VGHPAASYRAGPPACVSVTLDATSTPTVAELTGTVFAASHTLQVTTSSLSNGAVKTSYSATLAASGGTAPYAWKLASGKLPKGLKLDKSTGVISGKPTKSGSSTFTVEVSDQKTTTRPHTRNTAVREFSLSIS